MKFLSPPRSSAFRPRRAGVSRAAPLAGSALFLLTAGAGGAPGTGAGQVFEIPDWDNAARFELVASQSPVRPGDAFEVAVVARLDSGYHLYGPAEAPPTATVVEMTGPAEFEPGPTEYPAPIRRDLSGLGEYDLYEGEVAIRIPVTSGARARGSAAAEVLVRYQLCTDNACSAPTSTTLTLDLPLAAEGAEVRRLHPEVFGEAR